MRDRSIMYHRNPEPMLPDEQLAAQEQRIVNESVCWPTPPTEAEKREAVAWCQEHEALTDEALRIAHEIETLPRAGTLALRLQLATSAPPTTCHEVVEMLRVAGFLHPAIVISVNNRTHRDCVLLPPSLHAQLRIPRSKYLIRPPDHQQQLERLEANR